MPIKLFFLETNNYTFVHQLFTSYNVLYQLNQFVVVSFLCLLHFNCVSMIIIKINLPFNCNHFRISTYTKYKPKMKMRTLNINNE